MKTIHLTAKFQIQDGKSKEFKSIAEQCIAAVQKNELGKTCSQYDWYFSEDEKVCHVKESYIDSNGVMVHMGNVGELLGQLFQISTLKGDIYGELPEEVQNALSGLEIDSYNFYKGA